jgi:hypothetical protein
VCGAAFVDDSKTNSRKTCSDACRKKQAGEMAAGAPAAGKKSETIAGVSRVEMLRAAHQRVQEKGN